MGDDTKRLLESDFFEGETFRGGELVEADLADKELVRCTFTNVKLTQSRWRGARLEDCTFDDCELTRIEPTGVLARGVTFVGCKMMGIDWSRLGTFPTLAFRDCDLRYGSFVSLRLPKLVFQRCNLRDAQFVEVDLVEAAFPECQLGGARFERCDLRSASFADARELALAPDGNKLTGARVPVETAVWLARSFGLEVLGF